MALSKATLCQYAVGHYGECRILFITMLNVIMLSVIMLSVVAPLKQARVTRQRGCPLDFF
jgi:hypothetical protein